MISKIRFDRKCYVLGRKSREKEMEFWDGDEEILVGVERIFPEEIKDFMKAYTWSLNEIHYLKSQFKFFFNN